MASMANANSSKEYEGASVDHADYGHDSHHHHHHGHGLNQTGTNESARMPAFGGEAQPGSFRSTTHRRFGNPAPLGLSAFALTTFVLSLINLNTRGVSSPSIVLALAFGYGGIVQLLAGMWELAVGNTFGATALSSYGGFWLSFAIILTPGGFQVEQSYASDPRALQSALGFYLIGWWIFTTILLICTLRSTVAFFSLFFTLDLAFLLLAIARFRLDATGNPSVGCTKAGGVFGLLAAFLAWYNALAGLQEPSNSFFQIRAVHFPWSDLGRDARRTKSAV